MYLKYLSLSTQTHAIMYAAGCTERESEAEKIHIHIQMSSWQSTSCMMQTITPLHYRRKTSEIRKSCMCKIIRSERENEINTEKVVSECTRIERDGEREIEDGMPNLAEAKNSWQSNDYIK